MCRMYETKPVEVGDRCLLCAFRGGWGNCARSKDASLRIKAERCLGGTSARRSPDSNLTTSGVGAAC